MEGTRHSSSQQTGPTKNTNLWHAKHMPPSATVCTYVRQVVAGGEGEKAGRGGQGSAATGRVAGGRRGTPCE